MSTMDETQVERETGFNTVEEALEDLKLGKLVVVVDDEDRENEGDVVCAAETITPAQVNFIIREARGLLCAPMSSERMKHLGLDLMVQRNTAPMHTSFTVSVDAVRGTTTGISAQDRAVTIRALADVNTRPEDLARPGHVFPLRAMPGGVLRRTGHTEAVVDLMNLAGLEPVGALCEILDEDGTMGRRPYLFRFARKHHLKIIRVADDTANYPSGAPPARSAARIAPPTPGSSSSSGISTHARRGNPPELKTSWPRRSEVSEPPSAPASAAIAASSCCCSTAFSSRMVCSNSSVATPPNAIIYGSGYVKISDMAKTGLIMNFTGIILITLLTYALAIPVFHITPTQLPPWMP